MAENSHISWTDHTFNPWIGCTRVSPACDGCYAAELMGTGGSRFKRLARGLGWCVDAEGDTYTTPRIAYRALWEQINGPGSWAANPLVWAVSFERMI